MEVQEKANYLIKICEDQNCFSEKEILENSKHYAKIMVSEIISSWKRYGDDMFDAGIIKYWEDVYKEIDLTEKFPQT